MASNTQFSIAVHLMAGLGDRCGQDTKSCDLAASVNTSASFIRRVLAKLSKAGLVKTTTGHSGACWLAREPSQITLLEIYNAVGAPKVFAIHDYTPLEPCKVSCNIKYALDKVRCKAQTATEAALGEMTLAGVLLDLKKK